MTEVKYSLMPSGLLLILVIKCPMKNNSTTVCARQPKQLIDVKLLTNVVAVFVKSCIKLEQSYVLQ